MRPHLPETLARMRDYASRPIAGGRYDPTQFPFTGLLREAMTLDGLSLIDLDRPLRAAETAAMKAGLAALRARVIETMMGSGFAAVYARFIASLCAGHYGGAAYVQTLPSVRLSVPGALSTSWHTDNWYGHGLGTSTFWLPMTRVAPGSGVSFVDDPRVLPDLEARLESGQISLGGINEACARHGREVRCQPGEYLSFGSRVLHGSLENRSNRFRMSFDFRACARDGDLGNKPLGNYFLVEGEAISALAIDRDVHRGVKYITGATGASAKYQHILIEHYAGHHGVVIERNEAEIDTVSSRPVLQAYARRTVASAGSYDALLLYSIRGLPTDGQHLRAVLTSCIENGVRLHFALEDRTFPGDLTEEACLRAAGGSSGA